MKERTVKELPNATNSDGRAPSIKYQPRSRRLYLDVGIGSLCLSGADTGAAYCLLEVGAAPGVSVPRHTHTREDGSYYVLSGELEVVVGEEVFVPKAGDGLMAPRDIPHRLRNPGMSENHFLLIFSPPGFEEFVMATAIPAPDKAAAPTEGNFGLGTLRLPFRMSINSPPSTEFFSVDRYGVSSRYETVATEGAQ